MDNTPLLNSIKADLNPKNEQERLEIVHTTIPLTSSITELVAQLKQYQEKGYVSISIVSLSNENQTIELVKIRSPEEIKEYRLKRVQTFLKWFKDGLRRQRKILSDKEKGLKIYQQKIEEHKTKRTIPLKMQEKLNHKVQRLSFYKDKINDLENIIQNHQNYTLDELASLPNKIFDVGGKLK